MIARLNVLARCVLTALLLLTLFNGVNAHAQATRATVAARPDALRPPSDDDPPYNDAAFGSQTVPTTMTAGTAVQVTVRTVNSGTTTWTGAGAYKLGSRNPFDNGTWGGSRVPLAGNVAPGQTATFTFNVTAPAAAGSYNFQWGMVQDGVEWFGPPSDNVVVNVVAPAAQNGSQALGLNVPLLVQGQNATISVTMKNTGTTTWPAGSNYKLGSKNPDENMTWGVQRVDLASDVAPGQSYTFTFPITVPAAGTYTMQWQMMQRYVEWFGALASTSVTVTPPSGDTVTYIHTDALGSPVARSDSAGNVISRTQYEPYGRTAGGVTPTIGFTGHVNDADTGLVYMQQRYYDPVAGRFLSVDPVVTDANSASSFNRYAYANNSPYKYIDPDGRDGVEAHVPSFLSLSTVSAFKRETTLDQAVMTGTLTREVTMPAMTVAASPSAVGVLAAAASPPAAIAGSAISSNVLTAKGGIATLRLLQLLNKTVEGPMPPSLPAQSLSATQKVIKEIKSNSKVPQSQKTAPPPPLPEPPKVIRAE